MKKYELYREARANGMSYQEIANKYGCSRQNVQQACSTMRINYFKPFSEKACVFVNLRNWLNNNKVSRNELARRLNLEPAPVTNMRIKSYLSGKNYPPKRTIDKLIEITGISYEKMFETDCGKKGG